MEKLDVSMTPRYLTAVTLFIAFPLIIRGTSGRIGSLFLEKKEVVAFQEVQKQVVVRDPLRNGIYIFLDKEMVNRGLNNLV